MKRSTAEPDLVFPRGNLGLNLKNKQLKKVLFILFTVLLPITSKADVWQDPKTKVNYQHVQGNTFASVISSPEAAGDIQILGEISIDNVSYFVTRISSRAFYGCSELNSVSILSGVEEIQSGAFENCENLLSIHIPETLRRIEYNAFNNCNNLSALHIVDLAAWCKVSLMDNVVYPRQNANPLYYAHHLYLNGEEIKDLYIPEGITTINGYIFYGGAFTSVHFPESVTRISRGAFGECNDITDIFLPTSLEWCEDAFWKCNSLTAVHIKDLAAWCKIYFGVSGATLSGSNPLSIAHHLFIGNEEVKDLEIPEGVTHISDYAFEGCSEFSSVTIPNSVTYIGFCAFKDCTGLSGVYISDMEAWCNISFSNSHFISYETTPLAYAHHLFLNGEKVNELAIPQSIKTIKQFAFYGCTDLISVTLPSTINSIETYAFGGCTNIEKIMSDIETPFSIPSTSFDSNTYLQARLYVPEATIDKYKVTEGWKSFKDIKEYRLYIDPVTNIRYVLNETGLTAVVDEFQSKELTGDINILNNISVEGKEFQVTDIYKYAFYGCDKISSINISDGITTIGKYAFNGCSGLNSITIPKSVINIEGYNVFAECSNLSSVAIFSPSIGYNWFSGNEYIKSLHIGSTVNKIENYAFWGCVALTEISLSDGLTEIGEGAFGGCRLSELTIPSSVVTIGNFAFIECNGLTSITSHIYYPTPLFYVFDDVVYNNATLYVPSPSLGLYNATEGWNYFKNIIPIDGIQSSVALTVTDEQNNDITDKVTIEWYDEDGNQIGTGSRLSGIADSTEVYYSVLLDEELGRVYREVKMRKVITAGEETITCQLEKIGRVTLEGRISATDIDKVTMTVDIKQMLNGKYEETFSTQTNEQGVFRVEVYDDETDITISGEGYLNVTLHRDGFSGNGNVGTIPVNLISGFSVAANVTLQKAVSIGEASEETTWNDGLNNIEFTLTNTTRNTQITDFTVQNGNLIIKSGADVGDGISLTAKSKQGLFADAATTFTLAEGANTFNLQLTELGGLDATCEASSNGGTTGYLYDSNDVLVGKGSYIGETLTMRHLPNGVYTLVSMGRSLLLGNMTRLTDMAAVGLSEGKDYVATRVEVIDGYLTAVNVSEVPRLDETQFYYTTGNTYFNANKSSLTVGNYLTLSAHVDFKAEHSGKVNGVTLTIDLPEGCQMVENSVIANREAVAHTVNGNRLTMALTKEQWQSEIRFCVIPTLNQSHTITAMASFDIDGQVQQPIGTAQFEAKGLSLSTPKYAASTNITVSGTAIGYSEISIYDNDVLIGKATSKADGSWTAQCELYKPYSHSFHDIYAKIITKDGLELTSETRQVEYDKYNLVPEKVVMYYGKNVVKFDLLTGITTPMSYVYSSSTQNFTFLADFTRNDTTQIRNVNIKVLNSDGTVRTLPTIFDGKQNKWVASTKYSSSSRLPRNVTVEYDFISTEVPFDSTRITDDNNQYINLIKNYVTNVDTTKFDVLEASESVMVYQYQTDTMDEPVFIRMEILDYDEWINEVESKDYFTIEDNDVITNVVDSVLEGRCLEWIWNNENRTMIYVEISTNKETANKSPNISNVQTARGFWGNVAQNPIGNAVLNLFFNAGDIINIINDYAEGREELDDWWLKRNQTINEHMKYHNETLELIEAKCPDGTLKLSSLAAYNNAKEYLQEYYNDANSMRQQFKDNLERVESNLNRRRSVATAISALGAAAGVVSAFRNVGQFTVNISRELLQELTEEFTREFWRATGQSVVGSVTTSVVTNGANFGYDFLLLLRNQYYGIDYLSVWYNIANNAVKSKYESLQANIKKYYKNCEQQKENEEQEKTNDETIDENSEDKSDFIGNGSTGIIDPSGYVYEAVTSNRLEGVTATCYQMVQSEDMYGDVTEEAVIWNAEDYSQQNPLKTDKTGFYRWDVPQGMWQVKYEKEGYETAYSEWLPVPPPQLDVNIGMKQSTPPTVKQMRGFESGITIEMAKYMRPETMTEQTITVTRNGTTEKGNIELLNAEKAPLGGETYASKVKFVPQTRFNTTDVVVVTVHKEVESYCGVKMENDHVETVKIESEITDIVADSSVTVPYQGEKELRVMVLPKDAAVGKILHAVSSSPIIASVNASDVTINEDGVATFIINGELPGGAVLDFTVDGTDVKTTSKIRVVVTNTNAVATPVASVRSGETISDTDLLTLSCATEGATIYYTLDGSCPCDEQSRIKYVGPITLPVGQVTLQAIAVHEGMEDSDVAVYEYTVLDVATGMNVIKGEHRMEAYYQDGCIVISGAKGASCRIYDLQGYELASRNRLDEPSRIKLPQTDVYVVNVLFSDGQTVVCKVLAK